MIKSSLMLKAYYWSFVKICLAACTFMTVISAVYFCKFGFDLTDEGFYLLWISDPFSFPFTHTLFGFIYHPIFDFVHESIFLLRVFNLLLTYLLAWFLAYIVLANPSQEARECKFDSLIFSAAISTSAISIFVFSGMWLPTPSYNTLAFQSILLSTIAVIKLTRSCTLKNIFLASIFVVGCNLLFAAKPSSFVVYLIFSGIYLILSRKATIWFFLFCTIIFTGLLLILSLCIDGTLQGIFLRLYGGIKLLNILGSGHSINNSFRFDELPLTTYLKYSFIGLLISLSIFYFLSRFKNSFFYALILLLAFDFSQILFLPHLMSAENQAIGLLLFVLPIASFFIYFFKYFRSNKNALIGEKTYLLCLLLLMPYLYSFGTNNNYWVPMASAAFFPVLAGVLALHIALKDSEYKKFTFLFCIYAQVISLIIIQHGIDRPYRQPAFISDPQESVVFKFSEHGYLHIPKSLAQYVNNAAKSLAATQFERGTPIIDLTGQSPGLIYALGARAVGQPWLVGGYSGSNNFVVGALEGVNCHELSIAWLLIASPAGQESISPEILESFGANLESDYESVGVFPALDSGLLKSTKWISFWAPRRDSSVAIEACSRKRSS